MVTKDLDIFRAAQLLIKKHGESAEKFALDKMKHFMDEQDIAQASGWLIIAQGIAELQKTLPAGRTVH